MRIQKAKEERTVYNITLTTIELEAVIESLKDKEAELIKMANTYEAKANSAQTRVVFDYMKKKMQTADAGTQFVQKLRKEMESAKN